jgi:hypothetical protein
VFEAVEALRQLGLKDVLDNLSDGVVSMMRGHYDDAVKHFRNVVDILRNTAKQWKAIAGSDARADKMNRVLNASSDYLFIGAHPGVKAIEMDARLGHDLAVGLTMYFTTAMTLRLVENKPE